MTDISPFTRILAQINAIKHDLAEVERLYDDDRTDILRNRGCTGDRDFRCDHPPRDDQETGS